MASYFKCKLNKSPLDFKCGETIRFEVLAYEKCRNIDCKYIRWELKTDDGKALKGLGSCTINEPLVIETTLEKPGFAYLICTAYNSGNSAISNFDKLEAGAGADIEKIKYHDTLPDDFFEYWNALEKLVADNPIEVLLFEEIEDAKKGFKAYDVRIKTPEGRPSAFILTMPEKEGKYPLRLNFMGYGIGPTPIEYIDDTIRACFNAHGIETRLSSIELVENYPDLSAYGFSNNGSNMTTYFRNMAIRNLTGLKYLKTLDNWDGENIVSAGGSQGAMQAITVAAHDSDIKFLDVTVPWFCDLGAGREGFMTGWRPGFAEGLRYFDTVSQGMLVKCPVKIFAGLGDYVCPPSGVTALYNEIKTLKTITFRQAKTHGYNPNEIEEFTLNHNPENKAVDFKIGKYRHFKGNEYEVLDVAYDCETEEKVVVYKALYGDKRVWVRPLSQFCDFVYRDNKVMKRFEYIG